MSSLRQYFPDSVNDTLMYCVGRVRCLIQYYINNDFSANNIYENIYVGDLSFASNLNALKEKGITHIVSVLNGAYELFPNDFTYKMIHVNDDPWVQIDNFFDESNTFIEQALSVPNNKVLIHCHKGISRSVSFLIAFRLYKLNQEKKIEYDEINKYLDLILCEIKSQREQALPNSGFMEILRRYICKLNGYTYDNTQSLSVADNE